MKIAFASDIHTELPGQKPFLLTGKVDVLVLAGDIGKRQHAVTYALTLANSNADHIVYVMGNHDYWGERYDKAQRLVREEASKHPNFHYLENSTVEINGVHFIGATAWTDFTYGGDGQPLNMMAAGGAMNDYKKIGWVTPDGRYGKLRPQNVLEINIASKTYIFDKLNELGGENCVVVTHHAPTHLSIPERFKSDNLNSAYVNSWGNEIAYVGPRLWFHGHIHDPSDYMVGDTRVLCNSLGYPGETGDNDIAFVELDQ
jgi:Icc-related predicted phosphoesterase